MSTKTILRKHIDDCQTVAEAQLYSDNLKASLNNVNNVGLGIARNHTKSGNPNKRQLTPKQLANKHGKKVIKKGNGYSEKDIEYVRSLIKDGFSCSEVVHLTGCSNSMFYHYNTMINKELVIH